MVFRYMKLLRMGHHAAPVDVMQQSESSWVLPKRPAPEKGRGRKGKGREGKGRQGGGEGAGCKGKVRKGREDRKGVKETRTVGTQGGDGNGEARTRASKRSRKRRVTPNPQ